jgi:hypothetical protein
MYRICQDNENNVNHFTSDNTKYNKQHYDKARDQANFVDVDDNDILQRRC